MSDAMRQVEVLRAACCVAGVDGEVEEEERRTLERLAGEVGVGAASLNAMIERAETDPRFFEEQFRVLKADPQETMQLLFRVSISDGDLRKREALVLKRLAGRLDVPQSRFDAWLKQTIRFLKKKKSSDE